MLRNTEDSYGLITRILHWLGGLLTLTLLIVGYIMINMEPSVDKQNLYALHKAFGVLSFFLVILRYIWRLAERKVALPSSTSFWIKRAAKASHLIIYFLMFLMAGSGMLMTLLGGRSIDMFGFFSIGISFNEKYLSSQFHNIHIYSSFILSAFVILHILAACYHYFIKKDKVFMSIIK